MLDSENTTGGTTSTDTPAGSSETAATTPPRRRRAAARPAGPPSPTTSAGAQTITPEPAAPEAAPVKAAAKTTRARTKKAAAAPAAEAAVAPGPEAADGPETGDSADVPAKTPAARRRKKAAAAPPVLFQAPEPAPQTRRKKSAAPPSEAAPHEAAGDHPDLDDLDVEGEADDVADGTAETGESGDAARRRRRRRGGRGRRRRTGTDQDGANGQQDDGAQAGDQQALGTDDATAEAAEGADAASGEPADGEDEGAAGTRRRRRRRRKGSDGESGTDDDSSSVHVREPRTRTKAGSGEVTAMRGSTRLEAKKQRRREGRDAGRRRPPILSEAEFLARRESVRRVMVVRQRADLTQIAVLEDDVLVEHYVASASSSAMVGNVYLGKVQNVLPSMEAAFIDIGRGRNAVLYAGEVNWDAASLDGQPKRIEHVLKSGDSVLVQVTKDPVGHKGSRLTSNVSLAGRFLVYVPDGSMSGISRKLPDKERSRLKAILKKVVPDDAGVIVRTAAEGATEEQLTHDVARLQAQWEDIEKKAKTASAPALLYSEPDLTVRVIRDLFNEDFERLVVSGDGAWETVQSYIGHVAPDLLDRVEKYVGQQDAFTAYRVDEQIAKGLDRKVWLPSGGSLVIDRTEAMTVVDVNTGKFVGKGSGNLEETVTRNNLEAAEEIVRQLRLRDIGGIIVIDFIDMVLESNRELVLRRLTECLGRDRTKHQVAEVTSLGLVQMTRKRIGQGLLEAFSEPCEHCNGRGVKVHLEPVEARTGLRYSGENVDRVDRVARAARAASPRSTTGDPEAVAANGGPESEAGGGRGAAQRARRSRAKAAAPAPTDQTDHTDQTDQKAAAVEVPVQAPSDSPAPKRPRRRATKAQGAPTPVG